MNDKKPIKGAQPTSGPSLFDALKQMVRRKEKITTSKLRARIEAQALFGKAGVLKDALDISKTAQETAYILARLAAVKARAEWRNEALAIHILHTTCRSCAFHGESTEGLLLKRRQARTSTVHYQVIQSPTGFTDLPFIELHRQTTVPLCHRCKPPSTEIIFQSEDPRQAQLPFNTPDASCALASVQAA